MQPVFVDKLENTTMTKIFSVLLAVAALGFAPALVAAPAYADDHEEMVEDGAHDGDHMDKMDHHEDGHGMDAEHAQDDMDHGDMDHAEDGHGQDADHAKDGDAPHGEAKGHDKH